MIRVLKPHVEKCCAYLNITNFLVRHGKTFEDDLPDFYKLNYYPDVSCGNFCEHFRYSAVYLCRHTCYDLSYSSVHFGFLADMLCDMNLPVIEKEYKRLENKIIENIKLLSLEENLERILMLNRFVEDCKFFMKDERFLKAALCELDLIRRAFKQEA